MSEYSIGMQKQSGYKYGPPIQPPKYTRSHSSKHKTFCAATVANKIRKRRAKNKAAKVARRKLKGWGTALRRKRLYNTAINGLRPLIAFLKERRKILKHLSENKEAIEKQFPSGGITSSASESILRYSK